MTDAHMLKIHLDNIESILYFTKGLENNDESIIIYNNINFGFSSDCEIDREEYENYIWVWINLGYGVKYCIGAFTILQEIAYPIDHYKSSINNLDLGFYDTKQDNEELKQPVNCYYICWLCSNIQTYDFFSITGDSWWHRNRYLTNGRILWLSILKYIRSNYNDVNFLVYLKSIDYTEGTPPWNYYMRMGLITFGELGSYFQNSQKNGILNLVREEADGKDSLILNTRELQYGFLFFYYNGNEMLSSTGNYDFFTDYMKLRLFSH